MPNTPKDIALAFLKTVTDGSIDEAYEKYVEMSGKHHNVYTPAGFTALKDGMQENETQMPNKKFTPKTVIADGELVAVHSHLVLKADMPDMSVVHMFRIRNGKIAEMWDCGQQIPKDSPNTDGAF
jgi:predicted SnoaL-like aldol condensation-catalyzing enzyme